MRDSEGNAIANAHILGFYRRICKLLYYNIKPVFVYDGGTPHLKRLTLAERRKRKRNDANMLKKAAEKVLATQLRLRELEKKRLAKLQKEAIKAAAAAGVDIVHDSTENPKYFDEVRGLTEDAGITAEHKAALVRSITGGNQSRLDKDRYVLPPMDTDFDTLSRMRQNDLRFGINPEDIEHDEIQQFIADFKKEGALSNIDSDVFKALPSELQYEILSDIRVRSRVTSYDRVQEMVRLADTPMDFSKLQVEGVIRRNTVTQKLLTVNQAVSKLDDSAATTHNKPGRIASQRNREYLLVKNEEGGWVLGGKATAGATKDKPLNLDSDEEDASVKAEPLSQVQEMASDEDDDVEFEEVKVNPADVLPPTPSTDTKRQQHSLIDDFEAYVDEDESIEQVMAKFAELEEVVEGKREDARPLAIRRRETTPMSGVDMTNGPDTMSIGTPRKMKLMSEGDDNELGTSPLSHDNLDFGDLDDTLDDADDAAVMAILASTPNRGDQQQQQHGIVISDTPGTTPKSYRHPQRALSPSEEDQLDREGFFTYWTAYVPTSFKERNPTYDFMVRDAIYEWDEEQLDLEKHSAERKLEKTSVNDVTGVECQRFWVEFLTSLERWRKVGEVRDEVDETKEQPQEQQVTLTEPPTPSQGTDQALAPAGSQPQVDIGILDFSSSIFKRSVQAESPAPPTSSVPPSAPMALTEVASSDSGVGSLAPSPVPSQAEEALTAKKEEVKSGEDSMEIDQVASPGVKAAEGEQDILVSNEAAMATQKEIEDEDKDQSVAMGGIEPQDEDDDQDDLDEAHTMDLANEEQDFTQLFPDMASLPGVTVAPKTELKPESEPQQESVQLTAEERAALEQQEEASNLAETRRLQEELKSLQEQKRRHNRDADDLTEQMVAETQALLRLFGIPYIVAPMEAEAQCADLQLRGVVEGIVTEDSDVFLFGGKRIFKNMFREERYVECYLMNDIERELGITRDRLIQLAHLLGSDYTNGIKGVGAITAMEILRLFPSLKKFAKWWRGGHHDSQQDQGQDEDDSKADDDLENEDEEEGPKDEVALEKLTRLCQKLYVPKAFPSAEVSDAYLHPMVDDNDEGGRFEWGIPDLDGLRDFLRHSLGWDRGEVDRVLLPIIRQMARASMEGTQSTLDNFFDHSAGLGSFQRRPLQMSARLRKVVSGLVSGEAEAEGKEKADKTASRGKKKRPATSSLKGSKQTNGKQTKARRRVNKAKEEEDGPTSSSEDEAFDGKDGGTATASKPVGSLSQPATQKKRRKTAAT
ncbi:DNA repair protein rad2 [Actinomortierella ambigua]|nr:DNA repair protein rad2 [Actinomortierella ambigua]